MAIPVYVKHEITFKENSSSGRFDVTLGPKQNMGKTIEGVIMTVHMPKAVLNMSLAPTQGSYTFDPVTKVSPVLQIVHLSLSSRTLPMDMVVLPEGWAL